MRKISSMILGVIFVCAIAGVTQASQVSISAGILLLNHSSARAEGMGGAQAAVDADFNGAQGWNPAGLKSLTDPEFSTAYVRGLVDDSLGSLSYASPINQDMVVGGGLFFYDGSSFDLVSTDGSETKSVSAQRDFLVTLTDAYGLAAGKNPLDVGINVKIFRSTLLGEYTAMAVAVDLGMRLELKELLNNLSFGLALRNLGTPVKYIAEADPLPLNAILGAAYEIYQDADTGVLLAADSQYDLESKIRGQVGVETWFYKMIAVRAGYKLGYDLGGFTAGAGFQLENFEIDYAFGMMQAMNSSHRVGLKYSFKPTVQPLPEAVEAGAERAQPLPEAETIAPKEEGPVEKIAAQIVNQEKVGGKVAKVVINIGSNQNIKIGMTGTILNAGGSPVAAIRVQVVDPDICLAEVIGLAKDIEGCTNAVVDRPVATPPAEQQ